MRTGRAATALLGAGVLLAAAATGCDDADPTATNYEYTPDMVSSLPYDSFAPNPNTRDGRTLLAPPPDTVPRGFEPLHFAAGPAEAARAARELTNPMPDVALIRQRGEIAFARWCVPCHGREGLGDGLVAKKFPRPPSLAAPHARGLADGQIFHVISFGQGVMPAYGQQIAQPDRWKIVRFLRELQATAAPPAPAPAAAPAANAASTGGNR